MYRGAAVDIDGRGTVNAGGTKRMGEVDKSERSNLGRLEFSVVAKDVFEESFEIEPSSSSTSFPEDSVSARDFALSRALCRLRLSCPSRVVVRFRTLRTGATGVVIESGLCKEISSSESLSSATSFDARLGYRN